VTGQADRDAACDAACIRRLEAAGIPPDQARELNAQIREEVRALGPPSRKELPMSSLTGGGGNSRTMTRDELLGLSGERDQWVRLALSWARSAYRSGYHDGHDTGYRTGYKRAVREWKITAAGMTHLGGRSFAEQDRRRYPPGGRLSWIIPRPGEADGSERR
jgi:hypothetical protein